MTRRGARDAAAVLAVIAVALLTGCVSTPHAPSRTAPNDVERAAVSRTTQAFLAETGDTRLPWVQLWTVAQFASEMQDCAAVESHGQLSLTFGLPGLSIPSYRIVGSGSEPDEAEAARIIERCAAATPLDDRVLRLPRDQWDALYSYELTTLRPCLLAHGFSVRAMPTRAEFENRLRAELPSSPYDSVIVQTRAAWYALSDSCPALSAALNSAVSRA
ncbi:MAG TPA: hypothetical protein VGM38_04330 [Pseudolysinimonas sp.]|jgi:hypothetical protein